jgi:hypothetical protein
MRGGSITTPSAWLRAAALGFAAATLLAGSGCTSKIYSHPALADPADESFAELAVIREREMAGSAVAMQVWLDGQRLVQLRSGRYAVLRVKPGVYHEVSVKEKSGDQFLADYQLTAGQHLLKLEAGKRYYLLVENVGVRPNSTIPVFGVHPIGAEAAQKLMQDYDRVSSE